MEGSNGYKKGLWTMEEDRILMDYIRVHGKGKWNRVAKMTGLKRCGKSCRLRWINYLSPSVKRGDFSEEEEDLIIRLHNLLGNRWSLIAGRVPGRTDNQVKNHWNTHLSKKLGVKEDKRKFKVSSRKISKSEKNMLNTNSKNCFPDDNGIENVDVKVTGEGPQSPIGCSSVEEPALSDDLEGCFWFSNDNLNIDNPSLTELLDGYSLDFVWQGL